MNRRQLLISANILFIVLIILPTILLFFDTPRMYADQYLSDNKITTGLVYLFVVIITTVFAPFAGLPLAPAVSVIIGPFFTALYSVIGWTIGATIAFFIARHMARPLLSYFVNLQKLERYESYIPENHVFLWLVFLRLILPVDILSYAIGLTRSIRFPVYVISTFIGVIPFSLIWAYGGYSFMERNYTMFTIIGISGLALFFLSIIFYYMRRTCLPAGREREKSKRCTK